jgi:hypothetical protein
MEKIGEHHSITLTGTLRYFTKLGDYRDYPDTPVAAKRFLVEVVDADGAHLAYGYTNDYGYFSIPGVNPNGGMVVRMWCYVKYSPYDYELRVVQSGNSLTGLTNVYYFAYTGVFYFPDDGQPHGVGQIDLPLDIYGDGACWIKDDLDRAFRYVSLNTPDQPGPATVRWTETSGDGDHWDPLLNQIHLTGEAEKAPDTVIHEYGHQVMANIYGIINYPPYLPLTHYIFQSCGSNCAWAEGWADFFPLIVNGNSGYTFSNSYTYNLEIPTWNYVDDLGYLWDNGDSVEGRVAGTLWDIFDSATDGFDTYYDGFGEIWDTFSNQTDNTFSQFYNAWKERSHNQQEFLACAYQNTIVYDTVSPAEAVDSTLDWSTGGNASWLGEKFESFNGGDAAQSGAITDSQNTWIKTNVTGPGTLKFRWKVSCEPNYDYLRFYIAGSEKDKITSEVDWRQELYPISSGSHELMWKYTKDVSLGLGCDCGWLDKVEWIPNTSPQLSNGVVNPTSGNTNTTFTYSVTYYDADGNSPTIKNVYIDGTAHAMTLTSGTAYNGVYNYSRMLTAGTHNYYFLFDDGNGGSARLPSAGTYAGPTVSGGTAGTDEIGVWRGETRYFYLDMDGDGIYDGSATERFGPFLSSTDPSDRPVAGDWNGNGTDEIGVWRGATRYFYLDMDGDGTYDGSATERFGPFLSSTDPSDVPVAGDWNGL